MMIIMDKMIYLGEQERLKSFSVNGPQWQIKSLKGGKDCLINDQLDTNDIWASSSKNNCPIIWNNTLIIMLKLVNSRLK